MTRVKENVFKRKRRETTKKIGLGIGKSKQISDGKSNHNRPRNRPR